MAEEVIENLQEAPVEKLKEMISGQATPQTEEPKPVSPVEPAPEADKGTTETKPQEPQLILGKFKTQDDVVKAYQELEKKNTREAQQRSKYREILDPYVEFDTDGNIVGQKEQRVPLPEVKPEPTKPQSQDDVLAMLESRYTTLESQYGPVRANLIIQAEMAQAITRKETESLSELRAEREVEKQKSKLRSLPEFVQLETEVDNYLSKMDNSSKMNPQAVKTVYNLIRGGKIDEILKTKEQEIQLKTAEIEKQKVAAQVEHPTKSPEEQQPDVNDVKLTASDLAKRVGLKRVDRY
jgi:hypothetical protein